MSAAEPEKKPLWRQLLQRSRRDRDRLEKDLVQGRTERRQYAGDPHQADVFRVRTRVK